MYSVLEASFSYVVMHGLACNSSRDQFIFPSCVSSSHPSSIKLLTGGTFLSNTDALFALSDLYA